jgi:hypothetical protein
MNIKKWFVLANEEVTGPFDTNETRQIIAALSNNPRIWWKGAKEWVSANEWQHTLPTLESGQEEELLWYIELQGRKRQEPITYNQLIATLKEVKDLGQVRVWHEGMLRWDSVFVIDTILHDLGVSRRQHVRLPINGIVTVETQDHAIRVGKPNTISEGGISFSGVEHVSIGQICKLSLDSSKLQRSVRASIEIIYVTKDGQCGAKFANIDSESLTAIVSYIRKSKGTWRTAS